MTVHRSKIENEKTTMKRIAIFALMCVVVCSCENDQRVKIGIGGDRAWVSSEEARQRANELIVDRYPGG